MATPIERNDTMIPLPFPPSVATELLTKLGVEVLFEKVLTSSDTGGHGRIVIPKAVAEKSFPTVDKTQKGVIISMKDVFSRTYNFKFGFWANSNSRMYIIENTSELQSRFKMKVGDVIVIGKTSEGQFYACGREITPEDTSKKQTQRGPRSKNESDYEELPAKQKAKTVENGSNDELAGRTFGGIESDGVTQAIQRAIQQQQQQTTPRDNSTATGQSLLLSNLATQGMQQKYIPIDFFEEAFKESADVHSMDVEDGCGDTTAAFADGLETSRTISMLQKTYTFWNGTCFPTRKDGIFRVVPGTFNTDDVNKVLLHTSGCAATVAVGNEVYRAYFDTHKAAYSALRAYCVDVIRT